MISSIIGQIGHPFYITFAWFLASLFAVVPNYAIAIALLTVAVMIVVLPVTLRGTRAMMKMQLLAPAIKELQAKYKAQAGATAAERQELRQRQQDELIALYRENNVTPTGGCLPVVIQFPIFIILYGTIRGLVHQSVVNGSLGLDPLYIGHGTRIYKAIEAAHGQLISFGLNLADSVRSSGLGWHARVPFVALIAVAVALQYVQMRQINSRNRSAAASNPQMQQVQKLLPLFFAVVYVSVPAGVTVYFIVSGLFRISQQALYRRDPQIRASLDRLQLESGNCDSLM